MIRWRPPAVAVSLVVLVTVLVAVFAPGRRVAGTPTPYCTALVVLFDTDEEMRRAADEFRADGRVREVRDERTKADNHERLTAMLRESGRHRLAEAARVSTTPASVRVVEAFGVDAAAFAEELRRGQRRVNHVDVCEAGGGWEYGY
ncbi:hypothetical protein [Saccharothrix hoggarensis]|uniref:Uncharacterized protein n=1 Tax=Saccharothrix hoggarensis TaxID=913853 RepID=A0ABW3R5I5_9PSEU